MEVISSVFVVPSRHAREAPRGRCHALPERALRCRAGPVLAGSGGSPSKHIRPLASPDTGSGQSDGAQHMDQDTRCGLLKRTTRRTQREDPVGERIIGRCSSCRDLGASRAVSTEDPEGSSRGRIGRRCPPGASDRPGGLSCGLAFTRKRRDQDCPVRSAAAPCGNTPFGFAHRR